MSQQKNESHEYLTSIAIVGMDKNASTFEKYIHDENCYEIKLVLNLSVEPDEKWKEAFILRAKKIDSNSHHYFSGSHFENPEFKKEQIIYPRLIIKLKMLQSFIDILKDLIKSTNNDINEDINGVVDLDDEINDTLGKIVF